LMPSTMVAATVSSCSVIALDCFDCSTGIGQWARLDGLSFHHGMAALRRNEAITQNSETMVRPPSHTPARLPRR
jgi:hypothetical protein